MSWRLIKIARARHVCFQSSLPRRCYTSLWSLGLFPTLVDVNINRFRLNSVIGCAWLRTMIIFVRNRKSCAARPQGQFILGLVIIIGVEYFIFLILHLLTSSQDEDLRHSYFSIFRLFFNWNNCAHLRHLINPFVISSDGWPYCSLI